MLLAIRDRATGWIAYTVIILLCIPFALWGINSYLGGGAVPDVAEVDGEPISQQEFQRAYQQQMGRLRAMMEGNFDPSTLDEERLKQQTLQQLINETVVRQSGQSLGLRVGDQQLDGAIRSLAPFRRDGHFDPELYQRVLLQQGLTPPSFEQNLRQSLLNEQLQQGIIDSDFLTDADLRRYVALRDQQRRIAFLTLPLEQYKENVEVSEEEIEQYYSANQDRFRNPEQVRLEYLELSLDQLAADIPVDETDLQQAYQERLDQYTRPEERRASHVLVTLPSQASQEIVEEARARAENLHQKIVADDNGFDDIVGDLSELEEVQGGDLGLIGRGMMEPTFEEALFALDKPGDISEPIRTGFGFHIIRLDEVVAGEVIPLDEVRAELESDLRQRRAEPEFFDAAETLANITFEQPDSLHPAAEALGIEVQETGWIDRDGESQGIASFPPVMQAAFSPEVLESRLNSESLEVEPGHVVVVRVAEHRPAAPMELAQVRDRIIEQIRTEHAQEAVQEELDRLLERARGGASLTQLAEEEDLRLSEPGLVTRSARNLDGSLLNSAFQLPEPESGQPVHGRARLANGDRALIVVSEAVPGELADLSPGERDALRRQLAAQGGSMQFQGFVASRRQQTDVSAFPERL
jgi:peptidyl-prolyl cis-trans isomerase D